LGLFVYRQFDWRRIYPLLVDTLSLTGAVMLIIGTATAMAWALTQSGFSQWLVAAMAAVPGGKGGFLAITAVAVVILGSLLEGIPAIVLFGPLLFPVAKAMGVHEVHYALVIILAMGIGLFSPPFGVGFYGACAIGRVSPDDALWRMWPYLAALVVALAIVVAVAWVSVGVLLAGRGLAGLGPPRLLRHIPPAGPNERFGPVIHTRGAFPGQANFPGRVRCRRTQPRGGTTGRRERIRPMAMPEFTLRQLLEAGVHFGHHTRRWNPSMAPFIFGVRNGVHILDLEQTVPLLQQALQAVRDVVSGGGRVLFVGTKRQASEKIAEAAKRCGQYYVNHRWLGGMLSNCKTHSNSIKRLRAHEAPMCR